MAAATVVVVMAKQPRAGFTKTRLCPPFSPAQAAALYEALLCDTFALAGSLPGVQLAAAITPAAARPYFEQIAPPGTLLLPITGADIGECLAQTFQNLFEAGFARAIALNADGPSLPRSCLLQAVELLGAHAVVLGPGEDGGYYLIGLTQPRPTLFEPMAWSTAQVLEQTLQRAQALGLRPALTPPWYDVDTAADAARLAAEVRRLPPDRLAHTRRFFKENAQLV